MIGLGVVQHGKEAWLHLRWHVFAWEYAHRFGEIQSECRRHPGSLLRRLWQRMSAWIHGLAGNAMTMKREGR